MQNRLYVRNIASSVQLGSLEALFDCVGEVETSELGPPDIRNGLITAYVQMRTEQGASDGIDRFNGHRFEGNSLIVTHDRPHQPNPLLRTKRRRGRK